MKTETVQLPEKWADKVRRMKVGDRIDITEKGRAAAINQAKLAFRTADFKTQLHHDILYLIRTK